MIVGEDRLPLTLVGCLTQAIEHSYLKTLPILQAARKICETKCLKAAILNLKIHF